MNDNWLLIAFGIMLVGVMILSMVGAALGWWPWE